jgi:hypothetical protein
MEVDGLPIWVVTGVESAIIEIELVRKYQFEFRRRIMEGGKSVSTLRGVGVDETPTSSELTSLYDRKQTQ